MRCTRQALGLDEPFFVVGGCDLHYADIIPSPTRYTAEACKGATVAEVPRRNVDRTVQDEIDARITAWHQGKYSTTTHGGPCPLCPTESAREVRVAQWTLNEHPPEHFFVAVSRRDDADSSFRAPEPSVCVSAYGERFRLCAVIYQEKQYNDAWKCYTSQVLYDGCWHTYDSCNSNIAEHKHHYESSPHFERVTSNKNDKAELSMEPVFFAYVREDYDARVREDYGELDAFDRLTDPSRRFDAAYEEVRILLRSASDSVYLSTVFKKTNGHLIVVVSIDFLASDERLVCGQAGS